jgi:hypothetical protein
MVSSVIGREIPWQRRILIKQFLSGYGVNFKMIMDSIVLNWNDWRRVGDA